MTILNPLYKSASPSRLNLSDIESVAATLKVETAALRAVIDVECRGSGFTSDGRLTMLYEPHIAYRYATAEQRKALTKAGVAAPSWGTIKYPGTVTGRYAQFETCASIGGIELACKATSWGLPQGMGFNHGPFGYASAEAMVRAFAEGGEVEQIAGMGRFISANPRMLAALRNLQWADFAYRYNGSGYKSNAYDTKLASAYLKFRPASSVSSRIARVLRFGARGDDVGALQILLCGAGHPVDVDNHFGRVTEQEVRAFQSRNHLTRDGIAGPNTIQALEAAQSKPVS